MICGTYVHEAWRGTTQIRLQKSRGIIQSDTEGVRVPPRPRKEDIIAEIYELVENQESAHWKEPRASMASVFKDSKRVTKIIINRVMERWRVYPNIYDGLRVAVLADCSFDVFQRDGDSLFY